MHMNFKISHVLFKNARVLGWAVRTPAIKLRMQIMTFYMFVRKLSFATRRRVIRINNDQIGNFVADIF